MLDHEIETRQIELKFTKHEILSPTLLVSNQPVTF